MFAALVDASVESTNPLSCTTPLKVSTLIWRVLSLELANIEVFTLVVIAESSKYSPVLSYLLPPAQPATETTNTRRINKRSIKFSLLIIVLFEKIGCKVENEDNDNRHPIFCIVPTLRRGNSSCNAPALRDVGALRAAFPRWSVGTI